MGYGCFQLFFRGARSARYARQNLLPIAPPSCIIKTPGAGPDETEEKGMDKTLLCAQLEGLAEQEDWYVPLFANAAALLWETLENINWAGFYIVRGDRLVLGPFQGKPACIHIPRTRGVCGAAWREDRTVLVPDVHDFPGHIACDSASSAEIVIPLHGPDGQVLAVLDIDSPLPGRFSQEDQTALEAFARVLETNMKGI